MPLTVVLPRALYPYAKGSSGTLTINDKCEKVADVVSAIRTRHPGVIDRVMTETGDVREHVNIFVGEDPIRFTNGLDTPVRDGDTITIVAAVSGG